MKLYLIAVCAISISLFSLPTDGQVIRGEALILSDSNLLQVQANGKAIIEWQGFDIGVQERVSFTQTHSQSPILNKVLHGETSQILGHLQANCPIYLVNPQGIFIGSAAKIETAAFLATTADISNEQFLSDGDLKLDALGKGAIVNLGQIQAISSDVILIARNIENAGSIEAENGQVCLSTTEMMLNPDTRERVFIRPHIEGGKIDSSGFIKALSIEMQTTSPYEKAIHHTGSIKAISAIREQGRIYLVAENGGNIVAGSLVAPSGEVRILGKEIALEENVFIDVSGEKGGTVLIGGDYQGENPDILNAETVTVFPGTKVSANSLAKGDGGKVIYWSDGVTKVAGRTEVKGGLEGGDGGFIEVSGAKRLIYQGISDRTAARGKAGTILFDPESTMTVSAAGDSNVSFASGTFSPTNTTSNISVTSLTMDLALGDVIINTNGPGGFPAGTGNLTFSDPVSWSANSLTCNVGNTATFNADVTNTGSGNFTVTAQRNIVVNATRTVSCTGSGNLSLIAAGTVAGTYAGISNSGTISTNTGTLTLNGIGGNTGNNNRGVFLTGAGSLTESTDGLIQITGNSNGTGTNNDGIRIDTGAILRTTGIGNIILDGTASASASNTNNDGVIVVGPTSAVAATGSGKIDIIGTGGGTNTNSQGFVVQAAGLVSSAIGNITVMGTGSQAGTTGCHGILLTGADSLVTSATTNPMGLVHLTGIGHGTGSDGIQIASGAQCTTTMMGNILLNGTGAEAGSANNNGINITGISSAVTTGSGNIEIIAQGEGTTTNNRGLVVQATGSISTDGGQITINGTGSSTGTNGCHGVLVTGTSSQISSSSNGSFDFTGLGGGTTGDGVQIGAGAIVTADGLGSILMDGTGSPFGSGTGVNVASTGSQILGEDGEITITGIGAANGGKGIALAAGCFIQTQSGDINLQGTGTANGFFQGIDLGDQTSSIISDSGKIFLNGYGADNTGGNAGDGIRCIGLVHSVVSGDIEMTGVGGDSATISAQGNGIVIRNGGTVRSSGSGDIVLTGLTKNIGIAGTGVELAGDSFTATCEALGTGSITWIGTITSGNNMSSEGCRIGAQSTIATQSGKISVTGVNHSTGSASNGVLIDSIGLISSDSGNISIIGLVTASSADSSGVILGVSGGAVTSNTGTIIIHGTNNSSVGSNQCGVKVAGASSMISNINGAIEIAGTGGGEGAIGILIDNGADITSSGNASIFMQTFNDLIVQDNSSVNALGSGNIALDVNTDLFITGGSGVNSPAFISMADGTGVFQVRRNMIVTGGQGMDSPAFIGNNMAANASGAMNFSIGGSCTLSGQTSFAQIGHVNQPGAVLGGNISMTAGNDINVIGGSDASAYARVGHGGQAGGATFNASNMQLLAGVNLSMTSNTGEAQIVNSNGPLTLVVDNLFPSSPKIGPGGFFLNSNLSATGELKIYTARRTQNSINDLINGAAFVPGPFDVDTATEQWRIYFSGGVYGGGPFTIYYKEPNNTFYNLIAANLVQLADLLPMMETQRLPFTFPNYHFQLCEKIRLQKVCAPTFSPFGSFIFEDDVYWIGAEF